MGLFIEKVISEGSPYKISIVGVDPIDISRRVVH